MTYQLPPPSNKPVWPIVAACLVVAAGIAVAAVFIGMNLAEDDDPDAEPVAVSTSDDVQDEPVDSPSPTDETDPNTPSGETDPSTPTDETDPNTPTTDDETPEPVDSPETGPGQQEIDVPGAIDCGGDVRVLATRTPSFAASICRTAPGTYVYRGKSDDVDEGIVLQAQRNTIG